MPIWMPNRTTIRQLYFNPINMEDGHKMSKTSVRQLNAVKILKDHVIVDFDEIVHEIITDKEGNLVKEDKFLECHPNKYNYPPHQDFIDSMKMLRKMVIDICGWKGEFKNFQLYTVTGITLQDMDDDESSKVIITCQKKIERSGQVFTFNTPATTLFNDSVYADAEALDKACVVIRDEAYLYIGGKHAEVPQLTLKFEDGENMKMDVEATTRKKKSKPEDVEVEHEDEKADFSNAEEN